MQLFTKLQLPERPHHEDGWEGFFPYNVWDHSFTSGTTSNGCTFAPVKKDELLLCLHQYVFNINFRFIEYTPEPEQKKMYEEIKIC